jgi:hypothetical protein
MEMSEMHYRRQARSIASCGNTISKGNLVKRYRKRNDDEMQTENQTELFPKRSAFEEHSKGHLVDGMAHDLKDLASC